MLKYTRSSRKFMLASAIGALTLYGSLAQASTLRIAMTAADIPLTLGQPDQGFEGNRFTGIPLYDALVEWDLSQGEKPSGLVPGLASEWHIDPANQSRWIFTLRQGVKFHDGSAVNADAIVWNVAKVLDKSAPQYAPGQIGNTLSRMPTLKSAEKIDDYTVALTTTEPDALLPYNLTNLFIVSPGAWQKMYDAVPTSVSDVAERSQRAWTDFAAHAVGSGPFELEKLVPRQQLILKKNPNYWNKDRIPRVDKVVLIPLPEANARTAALLSKQVDWIEAPAPDAVDQIKSQGFKIYANTQPHLWPWQFSFLEGSPWKDIRVRKAANLCLNRSELKSYLGGYMKEATGVYESDNPWYGKPSFQIKYDPDTARKLMTEAGYSAGKPLRVTVATSASGSGQMQPLPMNEYIQQSLKSCFFNVDIKVNEWNTLFTNWRLGAEDPASQGVDTINVSAAVADPYFGMIRFSTAKAFPPVAANWGYFSTLETERLANKVKHAFTPAEMDSATAELHEAVMNEVPFLFVAHDVGPRAISPAVTGVVQPQSWFIDLALVSKKE
ncbi:peptide/nickel transport system substrate-binding protein|uniref:Peptide/nickel transport system substrate-binding protein n=1 Tax=Brenneria salicis ATCC 15712 = DSM 30166 TaxID=714314 RepID=A0A366HYB0_9GAMM|nr:ABC transporter substrate-binding protein [Brenneria salicis]NMN93018.1 peptide/nickel transport system substrate-binding protein [Brenneria salicis ATCC 15712 = DSM 30166]RBP57786.1 peptide/nickel transport system substrate-binding protein [Brenneria salicis ATCC 15712 = DSM 30166]RLM28881.1 ABC transporter substrate-binding protein [Brenneria salicis ATCC 15712 = DSM 30166]